MLKPIFYNKRKHGQSIIETVVGCLILVPIVLFIVDISTMAIVSSINDQLAKSAARAASREQNAALAQSAAQLVLTNFKTSPLISKVTLGNINYDVAQGVVSVQVVMQAKLLIALPNWTRIKDNSPTFVAEDVEPIVTL